MKRLDLNEIYNIEEIISRFDEMTRNNFYEEFELLVTDNNSLVTLNFLSGLKCLEQKTIDIALEDNLYEVIKDYIIVMLNKFIAEDYELGLLQNNLVITNHHYLNTFTLTVVGDLEELKKLYDFVISKDYKGITRKL